MAAPLPARFPGAVAPLRVAHVLSPAMVGGLERVVELLSEAQQQAGAVVQVFASTGPGGDRHPLVQALRRRGVPVTSLELSSRAYRAERRELRRLLAAFAPHVVHTHGYRSDVLAGPLAAALGYATVSTAHGRTSGGLKNRLYEWLQLRAWRRMDAVVAVSRPLQALLARSGLTPDQVSLIPNGWDTSRTVLSRGDARARLGLPADAVVVGWVGRLSREKGADVMLEGFARTARRDAVLAMVGSGPEGAALTAQANRLQLEGRVRWLGLVPDAGTCVAAFDAFVLSSRTEGTPMALLEAISAGVPVVATRVGGVPDVVTPAEALLVPSEDPAELTAAIDATLGDLPAASRRAAAALERLRATHALPAWVAAHEALYRALLARQPGERS